jgi:hypothetical protein
MYEWVPFLHGTYYTYTEYAAAICSAIFFILGVANLLIAFVIKLCTKLETSDIPERLMQLEGQYDHLMHPNQRLATPKPYYGSRGANFLEQQLEESSIPSYLISFFSWTGTFFLAMCPVGLSFFGVLLTPFMSAVIMFLHFFVKIRSSYHSTMKKLFNGLRHTNTIAYSEEATSARSSYRWKIFIFSIISFISSYSLTGGCIAFYEDFVGLRIEAIDLSVSTTLSRYFQLADICPPGKPCHIYATLPEDATTAVFINLHTNIKHENIAVLYDTKDYYEANHNLRYSQGAATIKLDYLEQRGRRAVHSALLDGLTPETRYFVQIKYDGVIYSSFDYVTLPDKNSSKNLIISNGGDLGDRTVAKQITFQAGSVDPDVIIIGGDVAYDDGEHTCYFTWDHFFDSFTLSTLTAGRLVPFLFSVGNHDVGMNTYSGRNLTISEKGPLYVVFFPQHTVPGFDAKMNAVNKVPDLHERKSYHYHVFGNILHLNLDTAYLTNPKEQVDFISTLATAFPDYIKMASHHNPIYRACRGSADQFEDEAVANWVPLFDKFKFMAVFENHEHAFKKSFPLTGGVPTQNGAYYMGNGNWGAKPGSPTCTANNATGILEYSNRINHFWLMNVSMAEGVIQYTPFNAAGVPLIPTFSQDISEYMLE